MTTENLVKLLQMTGAALSILPAAAGTFVVFRRQLEQFDRVEFGVGTGLIARSLDFHVSR
jgi:hypothetical protein